MMLSSHIHTYTLTYLPEEGKFIFKPLMETPPPLI
jgi:hypothetical protein